MLLREHCWVYGGPAGPADWRVSLFTLGNRTYVIEVWSGELTGSGKACETYRMTDFESAQRKYEEVRDSLVAR